MKHTLLVGLGGFIGSIARYHLGGVILHRFAEWRFPFSTFCVNVLGCLVIGALGALAEHLNAFSPASRLFLFTGLLGGFTTFSAFGYEGFFLLRRGEMAMAAAYAGLSILCGFAAVWLGFTLIGFVVRR